MIINIQNVLKASQFSPVELSGIASTGEYTRHFDSVYFTWCMKQALLISVVSCDKRNEGVCVCTRSMIPDSCEIGIICVTGDHRRIGLGRKLLSHSLRNMRSMRMKNAFLWVNENNAEAMRFFTEFGFQSDGKRRPARNGIPGEELRMKIEII